MIYNFYPNVIDVRAIGNEIFEKNRLSWHLTLNI